MKIVQASLIAALLAAGGPALAQGTAIALGGLQHDTSLPVEVTSDNLSVANEAGQAVFEGHVVVAQGPMRLGAGRIEIVYAQSDGGSRTAIRHMVASGGVTFANGADAAESREAVYDPDAGTLVMTGDVLLSQGATAISGQKLTIDLAAGTGVMEGRVRTTFQTNAN